MEKKEFETAVKNYLTPMYIFDLDFLKMHMNKIKEILGKDIFVCFAMKANPFLIKPMNEYTDRFEVCSPGEYEICMRQKIDPEKIIVSGVNKTEQSMKRILELSQGKGIFTIESERHYDILKKCADAKGVSLQLYLRLSSDNQFGMDKKTLEDVFSKCMSEKNMEVLGIHYYSGTQKKLKKVEKEIKELSEYAICLKEKFQKEELELEYGPGLSVAYFESDKVESAEEQLQGLKKILDDTEVFSHISIEMGRFLASGCGHYLTEVVDVKHSNDTNYVIVDGGIHQINYYGQLMGMKKPDMTCFPQRVEHRGKYNICGSLCTINDVIVREVEMGEPQIGDMVVFHNCGAYSVTEGMALFLSRELPQILFYSDNNGFRVARKLQQTNIINSQMEEQEHGRID